jgi:hypothetical protein
MVADRLVKKVIPMKPVPQAEAEAYYVANKSKFPQVPAQLAAVGHPALAFARFGRAQGGPLPRSRVCASGSSPARSSPRWRPRRATTRAVPNSGGDLGYFRRGQMEPALEDAAFSLPIGKVSQPVRTPYGWHLLEPIERDTVRSPAGRTRSTPTASR